MFGLDEDQKLEKPLVYVECEHKNHDEDKDKSLDDDQVMMQESSLKTS